VTKIQQSLAAVLADETLRSTRERILLSGIDFGEHSSMEERYVRRVEELRGKYARRGEEEQVEESRRDL
jgi:hypothetical protein